MNQLRNYLEVLKTNLLRSSQSVIITVMHLKFQKLITLVLNHQHLKMMFLNHMVSFQLLNKINKFINFPRVYRQLNHGQKLLQVVKSDGSELFLLLLLLFKVKDTLQILRRSYLHHVKVKRSTLVSRMANQLVLHSTVQFVQLMHLIHPSKPLIFHSMMLPTKSLQF